MREKPTDYVLNLARSKRVVAPVPEPEPKKKASKKKATAGGDDE